MNKRLMVGLLSAVFVVAACGDSSSSAAPSAGGGGDLAGKTITVSGAFVDAEAQRFADTVKPFEDATGAKVTYNGDKTFEQAIVVQAAAGNTPDVGLLPQPGLLGKTGLHGAASMRRRSRAVIVGPR